MRYLPIVWPRKNMARSIARQLEAAVAARHGWSVRTPGPVSPGTGTVVPVPPYNRAVARFYAPALEPSDETVALPDDEAQHLVRVLRLERGAEVRVFNGRGYECRAVVELADKRGVVLRVVGPEPACGRSCRSADARPGGAEGRQDGRPRPRRRHARRVAIRPLQTRHVDVPQAQLARGRKTERWQRIAVSSSKQCGRAVVPASRSRRRSSRCSGTRTTSCA
jgi:hypothetical protein